MSLVTDCYRLTSAFPLREQQGLVVQIRAAAVSVPSNIAEGNARLTPRAYANFLRIAHGSLRELETLILVSQNVGFVEPRRDGVQHRFVK